MRLLLASDGSDDGLDALERMAALRGPGTAAAVTFVVGWPPRDGPMWRAVYERQFIVDDLHRALEETVEEMTGRLREIAGSFAREVETRVEDGDAAVQLAKTVEREAIDMLILGVTGTPDRRYSQIILEDVMARIAIPIVVVHGAAR